jgi:hypothetical protein
VKYTLIWFGKRGKTVPYDTEKRYNSELRIRRDEGANPLGRTPNSQQKVGNNPIGC